MGVAIRHHVQGDVFLEFPPHRRQLVQDESLTVGTETLVEKCQVYIVLL